MSFKKSSKIILKWAAKVLAIEFPHIEMLAEYIVENQLIYGCNLMEQKATIAQRSRNNRRRHNNVHLSETICIDSDSDTPNSSPAARDDNDTNVRVAEKVETVEQDAENTNDWADSGQLDDFSWPEKPSESSDHEAPEPHKPPEDTTTCDNKIHTLNTTAKLPPVDPLSCSICRIQFANRTDLTAHISKHYKSVECAHCLKVLSGDTHYAFHLRNMHPDRSHTNDDDAAVDAADDKRPPPPPALTACRHCQHSCTSDDLIDHMATAHPNVVRVIKCAHCDARFESHAPRHIHTHVEHPERCREASACTVCGRIFHTRLKMKSHALIHMEKRFECDICGFKATRKTNLAMHMSKHTTAERRFQCDRCDSRFANRCKLEVHQRSHTQAKPFCCPYCDKSYAHSTDLRRHRRTHDRNGEEKKRLQCEWCGEKFYENKQLVAHLRVHDRER